MARPPGRRVLPPTGGAPSAEPRPGPGPGTGPEPGTEAWHALDVAQVEARLGTSGRGLSRDEVAARRAVVGPNALEEAPPTPALVVLARQFANPLISILGLAAAVATALGELIDAGVIVAVLVLNAAIGFAQERKAEGAVRALMQLVVPRAHVVRDGRELEIDSVDLVPGDVVLVESGSRVPADLRLVHVNALVVDESLLTGESAPVTKRVAPVAERALLADRSSMLYTGAVVATGRARGIVVATGPRTELGAIAGLVRDEEETRTPLQERMARLGRGIGVVVGLASVVLFASGVALGQPVEEMFLGAVALAVAAIPEGLPVAFTITLALGVHRMARRRAIVRRLPAVETLGSTDVIGSDKTGTLSQNRMTVQAVWVPGTTFRLVGSGDEAGFVAEDGGGDPAHGALHLALLTGALTNEASAYRRDGVLHLEGDPTESALLVAAIAGDIEPDEARSTHDLVAEVPFESERRWSAALREEGGRRALWVKGAPERVLELCDTMPGPDGLVPLDADEVGRAAHRLAGEGLRVLGMACRRATPDGAPLLVEAPAGLTFVGLQGMMDPPRPGVRAAIQGCHQAGIRVIMITGDHAATARAIAVDLGIAPAGAPVVTGEELATLDDDALRDLVPTVSVYARVAPEDKLRIVRALQGLGHVVAVTGDGVNDAPALKAAAIGIAMGQGGTDVAREAADMVLADDDFVTITAAVEEGRVTFDNIRKVTFFLVSTAAATIFAILAGVWLGWPLLMLPAQLLWLNLVTNGLQDVALAFEPGEQGVARRPPRPLTEGVLSRVLWQRAVLAGVVMAAGTLALFRWQLDRAGSLELAQTTALSTMVVFMAFQAGNARSGSVSLLRLSPTSNRFLLAATVAALAVHVGALHLGFTQAVLRVEPLDLGTWVRIVAVAASILVAMELHKALTSRRGDGATGALSA